VNGFLAVYVESVSITYSSYKKNSWTVSFVPMFSTSIEPGHIKALHNRFQNGLESLSLQITMMARSSPSLSWVDCITITAEALRLYRQQHHLVVEAYQTYLLQQC